MVPFTLVVILPTNKKLLDPSLNRNAELARQLLQKWGRLHAVRTALSLAALVILLWAATAAAIERDVLRAREAGLRQDLFTLRQIVS